MPVSQGSLSNHPGMLTLDAPEVVLELAEPLISHFTLLVGLPQEQGPTILSSSLTRMAGWVCNLSLDGQGVFRSALLRGIALLESMPNDVPPGLRLARGLGACYETLADALCKLKVHGIGASVSDHTAPWTPTSGSVWGWAQAHGYPHVWILPEIDSQTVLGLSQLLLGRVLSGATLDWLEREHLLEPLLGNPSLGAANGRYVSQDQGGVIAPGIKRESQSDFKGQIRHAIHSLLKRGVWNLNLAKGRIFLCQDQVMLLWPLGGRDLFNERQGQESPFLRPVTETRFDAQLEKRWREQLIHHGCLVGESEDGIVEAWHPLWHRFVRAVQFSAQLGDLFGMPP